VSAEKANAAEALGFRGVGCRPWQLWGHSLRKYEFRNFKGSASIHRKILLFPRNAAPDSAKDFFYFHVFAGASRFLKNRFTDRIPSKNISAVHLRAHTLNSPCRSRMPMATASGCWS
jgi:hypothetical protein